MTHIKYDGQKATISKWIIEQIAKETNLPISSLTPQESLTNLPIDSIFMVSIADQLEIWSGHSINPTIFWEFDNIDGLSEWLSKK